MTSPIEREIRFVLSLILSAPSVILIILAAQNQAPLHAGMASVALGATNLFLLIRYWVLEGE